MSEQGSSFRSSPSSAGSLVARRKGEVVIWALGSEIARIRKGSSGEVCDALTIHRVQFERDVLRISRPRRKP